MRASELIGALQAAINEHGDYEVVTEGGDGAGNTDGVERFGVEVNRLIVVRPDGEVRRDQERDDG